LRIVNRALARGGRAALHWEKNFAAPVDHR
jgi:hypothetical protein